MNKTFPTVLALTVASVLATTANAVDEPAGAMFMPSPSPLVAVRLLFRVGSQDDPRGKEGLAALTAAMVAEGGTKELA